MNTKAKSSELHLLTKYEIMSRRSLVSFSNNGQIFSLRNRKNLKKYISGIFKREGVSLLEINYIFCSDKELLNINKEFLNHDFLTDIITFEQSNDNNSISGEIYISIDRVKENSSFYKVSFTSELHRVIFHGVLHLCGYKDKTRKEKRRMTEMENFYLKKYFQK